jgi:hypothetical protein
MKKRLLFATMALFCLLVPAATLSAEEDEQFIQNDDVFITRETYKNQDWIYVYLAKMTKEPTKETKQEGQFLQVIDGKSVWTKFFYVTRIATPDDLKIGTIVISPEISGEDDVYRAPENKDEARNSAWYLAKITDVSDLYKEYVTVSGGYKIRVDALRVILPQSK